MKSCVALRWSSARIGQWPGWHTTWKQSSRSISIERRRNDASPVIPQTAASDESFHVDPENKTVTTAVGELPLSPVMDPSYWEATTRHQTPKPRSRKAQNSVERQFRKNPFAKALAPPIRQCTATRARLPTFFLQDFSLIAHPETGQPWWIPRSLAWEQAAESQEGDTIAAQPSEDCTDFRDEQATIKTDRPESNTQKTPPGPKTLSTVQPDHTKAHGPSAHVLARQDLISAFTTKRSGFDQHPRRLLGGSSSRYQRFAGKAVWREDMGSLILDRIRKDIVRDLLYLSELCTKDSRHYIVRCYGWDDVQYKHKGAVLWFEDTSQVDAVNSTEIQPGPFATYDVTNNDTSTRLAVHNIPTLLGTRDARTVKEQAAVFKDGSLFMLAGRRTTNLQLKLWRLQGYLADYGFSA
ncbi:hypothetical protein F5Y19DRAFT_285037 [Xylariaceae sp. FL1651]|nr:hypothetical protein F5Y19DRAFT_285037 [Xylariaceae sp. FL1651]